MPFNQTLSEDVLKAIHEMGFRKPTKVQQLVMEYILNREDVVVKAKTGSGKTAAFAIPIVDNMPLTVRQPKALVLTPTRELAVQVSEEVAAIGRYKKIRSVVVYGKQNIMTQINQLKQRVHVVVGTPGRVMDLIRRGELRLHDMDYFVLDEADELLRRGFLDDIRFCIDQLPEEKTTLLFSATMPAEIKGICERYMKEPQWIEIEEAPPKIKETNVYGERVEKFELLQMTLHKQQPFTCMVFCNTKSEVDGLFARMKSAGWSVLKLHGDMNQRDRLRTIDSFKNGDVMCLIATDLAARGIHVDNLDLVVNYHLPHIAENYTHRIGRTGRKDEEGLSVSFIDASEMKEMKAIEKHLGIPLPITGVKVYCDQMGVDCEVVDRKWIADRQKKADSLQQEKEKKKSNNNEITQIRIGIGKKKKVRAQDVVGAVSNIEGVTGDDIGIIDVRDTCTYVDIMNHKGTMVLKNLKRVKGKQVKVVKIMKRKR